jgi:hypothetical protein
VIISQKTRLRRLTIIERIFVKGHEVFFAQFRISPTSGNIQKFPEVLSDASKASPLFEIALALVHLDHIASRIVNANHGIM